MPTLRWQSAQWTVGVSGLFSGAVLEFKVLETLRRALLIPTRRESVGVDGPGVGVAARLGREDTEGEREIEGVPGGRKEDTREFNGRSATCVGGTKVQPNRDTTIDVSEGSGSASLFAASLAADLVEIESSITVDGGSAWSVFRREVKVVRKACSCEDV
jgi:hypothetical protein